MSEARERLAKSVADAEENVAKLRAENAELAEAFRADPSDAGRDGLKRAAAALANARDRVDAAKAALAVFDETGSEHGLVARDGKVMGTIAVAIAPGSAREAREAKIDEALSSELDRIAAELGAVLAASPSAFTRELPGRDDAGRTVLEVAGRVEGDRLVPAVSRAAKMMR